MDVFQQIEALIEGRTADGTSRARETLARFGTSEESRTAIDEFLLDMMTLEFVVAAGGSKSENALRELAQWKFEKVRRIVTPSR